MNKLKMFGLACWRAGWEVYQYQYSYRASALAFMTSLAIVPMITVFVYILTHFFIFTEWNNLATDYVINNLVPSSAKEIIPYLNKFTQQAAKMPTLSILFLFVTTIFLIDTIRDSMEMIWEKESSNDNILTYVIYTLIVFLLPFFVLITALLSSYLTYLFNYISSYTFLSVFVIPLLMNTVILSILYSITALRIKWAHILLGAFTAAFILESAKIFFVVYIRQFTSYELIYGALYSIPVLLIWLLTFWMIILYGAVLVKKLAIIDKFNQPS